MKLLVYSSSRAIRENIKQKNNGFLDYYQSISEFFSNSLIFENLKVIDSDTRDIYLHKASDFKNFKKLQIERDFFRFLKSSSYIYDFFSEISQELVSVSDIKQNDVYAEFEEHLDILEEFLRRYEKLLLENSFIDRIFFPKYYKLNKTFIESFDEIEFYLDGLLSNFELKLLDEISDITKVKIYYKATVYNQKMQQRFASFGLDIKPGFIYTINFSDKSIISKKRNENKTDITLTTLPSRELQVAFVKYKIANFVQKGYLPQNIAVILPNEDIKDSLKFFDFKHNLNFAMGDSFKNSYVFKKLQATMDYINEDSKSNEARLERYGYELFLFIKLNLKKYVKEINLQEFFDILYEDMDKTQKELVKKEIYSLEKLTDYIEDINFKEFLNIFTNRLSNIKIDDTRGGKITVLGVLESRGMKFDGVIVLDFNEGTVPKTLDKDMFLNSAVKKHSNLPTKLDREALQKHYYINLFENSKEVCLCCVEDEQNQKSRFLEELEYTEENIDKSFLEKILFKDKMSFSPFLDETKEIRYRFKTLSNSKLKIFLECKRKFYYKYVKGIEGFALPKDLAEEWEIGEWVHIALKNLYSKTNSYKDKQKLKRDFFKELDDLEIEDRLLRFKIDLYKKSLDRFFDLEIKRFDAGIVVEENEMELTKEYNSVLINGKIDRLDRNSVSGSYDIIDYKTGSVPVYNKNNFSDATDFQLQFYKLLCEDKYNVGECFFYDIKNQEIVKDDFFDERFFILKKHLDDISKIDGFVNEKTTDLNICRKCEYRVLCQR